MHDAFPPVEDPAAGADLLSIEQAGAVVHVRLNRPGKRNALSDQLIARLHACLAALPATARAVVLSAQGEHFCAGLDLAELLERDAVAAMAHSRSWHAAFDAIQHAPVPVVAALHGAVVGGGLELAAACHLRVADATAYFALPEGQRGLFVGGGGSVRISRLIGVARMTDLMLTGRVYGAHEALQAGLVQYAVDAGQAFGRAVELATRITANAPLSNQAVIHALPRIAEMPPAEGLYAESLMSALSATTPDAVERLRAFLDKRAGKVGPA